MTRDELAAMLNNREYGLEMTKDEERAAKQNQLLVAFGASDDNLELRGVVNDELSAYDGCQCYLVRVGNRWQSLSSGESPVLIEAIWNPPDMEASWEITTPLPSSQFNIREDGELFCVGVVIDERDMLALIKGGWSVSDDELNAARAAVPEVEDHVILSILTAAANART